MKKGDCILTVWNKDNYENSTKFNRTICDIISQVCNSPYVHMGFLHNEDEQNVYIYESLSKGPVLSTYNREWFYSELKKGNYEVFRTREHLCFDKGEEYLRQSKGKKYGYGDLIRILISKKTGWKWFRNTSEQIICSEFGVRYYIACGSKKFKKYNPNLFTPAEFPEVFNKVINYESK